MKIIDRVDMMTYVEGTEADCKEWLWHRFRTQPGNFYRFKLVF